MAKLQNKICLFVALLLVASCATKDKTSMTGVYKVGKPYTVAGATYTPKEQPTYDAVGMSSWYGSDFHGKKTANGATYDKNALTAAHNTLPLPSMVRVTNLENNKTLIVMINDRGPFTKGRIIDVSEKAAEILGYKDKGVAKVRVQFLPGQTKRLLSDMGIKQPAFADTETAAVDTKVDATPLPAITKVTSTNPADDSVAPSNIKVASSSTPESSLKAGNVKSDKAVKPIEIKEISESDLIETEEGPAKVVEESDPQRAAAMAVGATTIAGVTTVKAEPKEEAATAEAKTTKKVEQSFIQAGTYSLKANAQKAEKKLKPLGDVAIRPYKSGEKTFYRVRLGPIEDEKIAQSALKKVIKLGHADAMLIKDMVTITE
ncbi:MAG: rare lipoprotein [Rickettsiaceae bacterium]|jgi:rare lipoprotein A|nr:rare lipoprotein [Rickettsiaceae bacterium]